MTALAVPLAVSEARAFAVGVGGSGARPPTTLLIPAASGSSRAFLVAIGPDAPVIPTPPSDHPAPPVADLPGDWAAPPVPYLDALTIVGPISVTGTTATATTDAPHPLVVGQQVKLQGIDYPGANFLATVTGVPTSTTFTYEWAVS